MGWSSKEGQISFSFQSLHPSIPSILPEPVGGWVARHPTVLNGILITWTGIMLLSFL